MSTLVLIALSLVTNPGNGKQVRTADTYHVNADGSYTAHYKNHRGYKARNAWDTMRIASDEGNNGIAPTVIKKGF